MSGSLVASCPISPVSQVLTLIRLEFIHQRTPVILASDFRQTNDCVVSSLEIAIPECRGQKGSCGRGTGVP